MVVSDGESRNSPSLFELRLAAPLPPDVHTSRLADGLPEQSDQMFRRPSIGDHVDGVGVDEVVAILGGFFFECVHQHLEVSVCDGAD